MTALHLGTGSESKQVWIVEGVRTPFVRARGVFKKLPPSALGGVTLKEVVGRSPIAPEWIEEIYFGIVSPPAEGSHVAREALFDSLLPSTIPCTTVNRYCASAGEAIAGIAAKIASGQIQMGIGGGVESISSIRALFSQEATDYFQDFLKKKTWFEKWNHLKRFQVRYCTPFAPGIKEPTTGLTMGQSADLMAREFGVTRLEQDRHALESHQKAHAAWERGFYQSHVMLVGTPEGGVIERDTDVRSDTQLEKLSSLKPVFYPDGTITAGNASPLTDGASAVLLVASDRGQELQLKPLGRLRSVVAVGIDIRKEPLLIGPVYAIPKALKRAGIEWKDLDLIEIHEAFSAQVLATFKAIESAQWAKEKMGLGQAIGSIDPSRVNVNGGSVALGHPFGATGGRLLLQLLHELRLRKKQLGLLSLCAAGGLGMVMVVEAL